MNLATPIIQRWIEDGHNDPEGFWERAARELPWFRTWDTGKKACSGCPPPD